MAAFQGTCSKLFRRERWNARCWHSAVPAWFRAGLITLLAPFACSYCLGLLESTTGQGYTPLGTACYHGHVAPARVLLAQGAAVDGADPATAGPLVAACSAGKHLCSSFGCSQGRFTAIKPGIANRIVGCFSPLPCSGALQLH